MQGSIDQPLVVTHKVNTPGVRANVDPLAQPFKLDGDHPAGELLQSLDGQRIKLQGRIDGDLDSSEGSG